MINAILIFILCFLATTKVTLQGRFAKTSGNTPYGVLCFNTVIFAAAALLFARWLVGCHAVTAVFGAVFGVLTVMFQLTYVIAMSGGNVSLTVMMVNFSMIIPIAFSVIYGKEQISPLKWVGILLIAVALLLTLKKGKKQMGGKKSKWLIFAITASLLNGALAICQKLYGLTFDGAEESGFVAWTYITAFLLSLAICIFQRLSHKSNGFTVTARIAALGASAGVILAVFQWLNTYAISTIEGAIIFPSYYGGSMVLSTLSGVIILKDKLTKKQLCAVLIGVVALVLLNI